MTGHHRQQVIRTRSHSWRGGARTNAGRKKKPHLSILHQQAASIRITQQQAQKYQRKKLKLLMEPLINAQGRCSSQQENKFFLLLMLQHQLSTGCSPTTAQKYIAHQIHKSHNTLRRVYYHYIHHKEVLIPDNSNRGAGSPRHISHSHQLTSEQVTTIHQTITTANQSTESCSIKDIQEALLTQHNITVPRTTLQSLLHRIGYHYGAAQYIGTMNDGARKARIRSFLLAYSSALQEQAKKNCIIVYTDESYIHSTHSSQSIWYSPNSATSNNINRPIGRGIRFIILHAMSSDGLLCSSDIPTPSSRLEEKQTTAEFIFESVTNEEDYHKSMNGDVFLAWLTNRLIPTFKRIYKRKKMVLVLDNASYHHVRGESYINPNNMNKNDKLVELGVTSIKVARKSTPFPQASFYQSGGKWAPTVEEMRQRLKEELQKYPQYQTTEVSKVMKEHGYQCIYTPPYTPTVQPIEMIWAYVKNYVARQYTKNRNKQQLVEQTRRGFYGHPATKHRGVTAHLCTKLINHCHKWSNKFIEQDLELDGSVDQCTRICTAGESHVNIDDDIEDELDTLEQTNELPEDEQVI